MCNTSVKNLVDKNLCYQCGTCKSICPTSAIEMKRVESKGFVYPSINTEKCVNCGKCTIVCPINNIDYRENHLPTNDDFIGIYNSTDKGRFDFTASGGIVTEIISYLFKIKKINKAIVTGMNEESKTNSKVYVINNINKLKEFSGSVYQPVSVNEVLDSITKDDRVAFVGLPCHMRGLDLFLSQNNKLKDSFVIKLGLICTIGRGKHGTTLTLKKSLNIKNDSDIKKIIYRYGMPPGTFKVKLKNENNLKISTLDFNQNTDYIFIPKGCLFCTDLFNDKADITVGDPWGMGKGKKAMVIVRSYIVKIILKEMLKNNMIIFNQKITWEECIKTQSHSVNYKINNYKARISAYKKIGVKTPNIRNITSEKISFKENLGYNLLMINSLFFNTSIGLKIAKILPNKFLYKYRNKILDINTRKRKKSKLIK